jgi:hypothetical protein
MAETPLFLSVMALAYRDIQSKDILTSGNFEIQRKHLFDTYVEHMFERHEHSKNEMFKKQDVLRWLSWLARKMTEHNQIPFFIEGMQPTGLGQERQLTYYKWGIGLSIGLISGLFSGLVFGLIGGLYVGLFSGLVLGVTFGSLVGMNAKESIQTVDIVTWSLRNVKLMTSLMFGMIIGVPLMPVLGFIFWAFGGLLRGLVGGLVGGLIVWVMSGLSYGLINGLNIQQVDQTSHPEQRLVFTMKNLLCVVLLFGLLFGLTSGLIFGPLVGLITGLFFGMIFGYFYGGSTLIQHYSLRLTLFLNNLLPWKIVSFLDYCTDLIFLHRVGGAYIFVHRLLMEHFAAMYTK